MNPDKKINKLDFWINLIFVMAFAMAMIALSSFVWGETDENGELVGLAANVSVVSVLMMGLLMLGMMLIVFMGLSIRSAQYIGENHDPSPEKKPYSASCTPEFADQYREIFGDDPPIPVNEPLGEPIVLDCETFVNDVHNHPLLEVVDNPSTEEQREEK